MDDIKFCIVAGYIDQILQPNWFYLGRHIMGKHFSPVILPAQAKNTAFRPNPKQPVNKHKNMGWRRVKAKKATSKSPVRSLAGMRVEKRYKKPEILRNIVILL